MQERKLLQAKKEQPSQAVVVQVMHAVGGEAGIKDPPRTTAHPTRTTAPAGSEKGGSSTPQQTPTKKP